MELRPFARRGSQDTDIGNVRQRELIRHDQDRQRLRSLLFTGAATPPAMSADRAHFEGLRARVNKGTKSRKAKKR